MYTLVSETPVEEGCIYCGGTNCVAFLFGESVCGWYYG